MGVDVPTPQREQRTLSDKTLRDDAALICVTTSVKLTISSLMSRRWKPSAGGNIDQDHGATYLSRDLPS